jgi:hypothetical protein
MALDLYIHTPFVVAPFSLPGKKVHVAGATVAKLLIAAKENSVSLDGYSYENNAKMIRGLVAQVPGLDLDIIEGLTRKISGTLTTLREFHMNCGVATLVHQSKENHASLLRDSTKIARGPSTLANVLPLTAEIIEGEEKEAIDLLHPDMATRRGHYFYATPIRDPKGMWKAFPERCGIMTLGWERPVHPDTLAFYKSGERSPGLFLDQDAQHAANMLEELHQSSENPQLVGFACLPSRPGQRVMPLPARVAFSLSLRHLDGV